jgi:hypothetical protein
MADAVDDAGRGDRDPDHLYGPDRQADEAKQHQINGHHHAHTLP